MPYLLGLLGVIVTALVLLSRLADAGIDLGGLNPFALRRKRAWKSKFEANPLFGIEDPMDVAAVLAVGVVKAGGDMTFEQKRALLDVFQSTFGLGAGAAEELLASSAYLIGDGRIFREQVEDVVARGNERFTDSQIASTLSLLDEIAAVEGATERQRELIGRVRAVFRNDEDSTAWGQERAPQEFTAASLLSSGPSRDRSQTTFAYDLRTSLIIDPADGRIRPMTEEGIVRNAAIEAARGGRWDSVEAEADEAEEAQAE